MQLRDSEREGETGQRAVRRRHLEKVSSIFSPPCCKLKQVKACVWGSAVPSLFVENRTVQVVKCNEERKCGGKKFGRSNEISTSNLF